MKHLEEEQLIEHYYAKDRDVACTAGHIAECPECAADYAALEADLSEIKEADLPFRDPAYGWRVWEAIAPSLPEPAERKPSLVFWVRANLWRGWAYAAAIAVLVAGSFYAGRIWEHSKTLRLNASKSPAPAPAPPSPAKHVVVVVLSDHLDRSERLLVELKHAQAGSAEMFSPLRDEARALLPANRECERQAEENDDPQLQRALASLDRLLTEMAGQPGGLNATAVARLQDEMKAEGLLFEVRVLRSRTPAPKANSNHAL